MRPSLRTKIAHRPPRCVESPDGVKQRALVETVPIGESGIAPAPLSPVRPPDELALAIVSAMTLFGRAEIRRIVPWSTVARESLVAKPDRRAA